MMELKQQLGNSLIPDELSTHFDVVINPVRDGLDWLFKGTVKNNSKISINRTYVKPWLYIFDDKHQLWGKLPGFLEPGPELKPGEECAAEFLILTDKDNTFKSFGTGLSFDPYLLVPSAEARKTPDQIHSK